MKKLLFVSQYSKNTHQTKYKTPFVSVYMSRAEHTYNI